MNAAIFRFFFYFCT
ncbi:pheST operon leader peptide PheM [Escherichia coli]|nr:MULTISPECIES: pheST operon leader peptide PheM [Enterobacteriaceae]EER2374782.1 pheST operon leader peptide PheM [Escherichia coli]EFK0099763.1 pheST operon leader peptide PheM [Escherichia coli]EFM8319722.1 pheST operon leader peptide PheM [Escherichia coli]EHY1316002.1 pheST operon leader peptide PheM [Escherichia coli]EHY1329919.1 pheST operon leader peptide PheM [Escherichia coli]